MSTTMIPPDAIITEQRASALHIANHVKNARGALLARMAALTPHESCDFAADLIGDLPEVLLSLDAIKFVTRVRRIGATAAEQTLELCGIPQRTRLGELTPRQRTALESSLRTRANAHRNNRIER